MHLKNLALIGFKSFADKTSVNFLPGVTAIVGPNGCGKSNISDAIRWVLGEQSAKAMRGGEMADVIFTGTDSRKSMGMAEVSLTIGDVDSAALEAAGVRVDYNEVTLTRRVFRDGNSEYFINKTPCRLRDIQQLFMGTGVGRMSYSIMAQGNITQLLSSKPEDRRAVFEEAAGITKFKTQKREALRKLEHTEQNLLRVGDLIREVKRQIGSLQRQAGKARRYKQYQMELQHLETQLARHQFDLIQEQIAVLKSAAEQLRSEIEGSSQQVLRSEEEIGQLRGLLGEIEREVHALRQQGSDLKSQIERHEERIQFNRQHLKELDTRDAAATRDLKEGEERQTAARDELAKISTAFDVSNGTLAQHRERLSEGQKSLSATESQLHERQTQLRQTQTDAFGAAQQLARARNEIASLDLQKQGNAIRLEKLSAEKVQLEEERARLNGILQEFASTVESDKERALANRGSVEQRKTRLAEIQKELATAASNLDQLLQGQAQQRSRLDVLDQLQSDYEGFGQGAVAVLKGGHAVMGSLTDRIRVPTQYVGAIEAALGHHLQLVLAEHPEAAQAIMSDLSANKRGRASIAALSLLSESTAGAEAAGGSESDFPAELGVPAISVIECDDAAKPLIQRLLAGIRIVPDLSAATIAWKARPRQFDFVTQTGEVLDRHGIYTGGRGNSSTQSSASALGRKNQISELRAAVAAQQERINEASRLKGSAQAEQSALQAGLQEAQVELGRQEIAIAARQGEFNALQGSLRNLHQKIDTVVYEIQSLAAQEEQGRRHRESLASQLTILENAERDAQARLTEITSALDALRQRRDSEVGNVTEIKVALATEEQLAASLRQQSQALQGRLKELVQMIEQRRTEMAALISRRAQYETEIDESQRRSEALRFDREKINSGLADLEAKRSEQESAVAAHEEILRGHRRKLAEAQERRTGIEIEIAQKEVTREALEQRVLEKYQVILRDVRSECITITFANEGQPKVETLTPEQMAASGVATDWAAVAEQVSGLQKRIDEMGPVNLVAIEEYEEAEQRHEFLSTQHQDLVDAKQQLLEVINRINSETRELFIATFNQIQTNFRLLFSEIFGGGKADLRLSDEGDVLESGIEIVARPPGKQLQTISLLSGGEQTMTAVALLFAIYQVKPSPFCVLDELDAPLDDANINRFIRVLQRFLDHSQFVIITHNKRTIGMADVLHGVTMQEHGISKIVSVKLHKADETLEADAKPLVPAVPEQKADPETRIQHSESMALAG